MKKRYIIALIIVIILAVSLGIFKIINVIARNGKGDVVTIPDFHDKFIEIIKNENDEIQRRNQIDAGFKFNYITQEEVNEL